MWFCQRWNCCFCSQEAEFRVENSCGRFQISENFITRLVGGGCDQDASFKDFLVNGFRSSLRIMSRAGCCCVCFQKKIASATVKSIRERLLDGTETPNFVKLCGLANA